jgi:hypothetical protein
MAVAIACVVSPGAAAQTAAPGTLTVADVLARTTEYVRDFEEHLAGIVAEEHYVQDSIPATMYVPGMRNTDTRQHRELNSDLLLVRPKGADRWVQFRDVFEVDGQPVRDRSQRLTKLFLAPWSSISEQVWQIAAESSRYNIGSLTRNINVPVLPLLFLDSANQSRFEFSRVTPGSGGAGSGSPAPGSLGSKEGKIIPKDLPARPAFAVAPDVWEIRYKETAPGTLIRTTADRDLPASGRFWIEPDTGRVLMTEFLLGDPSIRAAIDVSYQTKPVAGFLVPIEMREDYQLLASRTRITGVATYAKFRTFQVNIDEQITPPPEK